MLVFLSFEPAHTRTDDRVRCNNNNNCWSDLRLIKIKNKLPDQTNYLPLKQQGTNPRSITCMVEFKPAHRCIPAQAARFEKPDHDIEAYRSIISSPWQSEVTSPRKLATAHESSQLRSSFPEEYEGCFPWLWEMMIIIETTRQPALPEWLSSQHLTNEMSTGALGTQHTWIIQYLCNGPNVCFARSQDEEGKKKEKH